MQKFNYHCHTSFKDIFDGHNTADEMLSAYEQKGINEIGFSNHCICHPVFEKLPFFSKQAFFDVDTFIEIYKQSFDWIDEAASKHNVKVFKGLEVDFFPSAIWNKGFEKILKELKPDYTIGATHFIRNKDETALYNIYFLNQLPSINKDEMNELLNNYWSNIVQSIESGYFKFIVHPDYCCQFGLCETDEWNEHKYKVIDALAKTKKACEINTGGLRRIGRPYPDWWMINEMIQKDIPLLISDDAHTTKDTCSHFEVVENKLKELGCKKRFSFNK